MKKFDVTVQSNGVKTSFVFEDKDDEEIYDFIESFQDATKGARGNLWLWDTEGVYRIFDVSKIENIAVKGLTKPSE